jgi:hypothetical protein
LDWDLEIVRQQISKYAKRVMLTCQAAKNLVVQARTGIGRLKRSTREMVCPLVTGTSTT